MRVVLRNPLASDGRDFQHSLTVNAEYEVLGIEGDSLRLLNDHGEPILYDPECFEVIDPLEPDQWMSKVGDQGKRYAYPPGWGVPGFFEAWHDRNEVVRKVFAEQLAHWYPVVRQADKPSTGRE